MYRIVMRHEYYHCHHLKGSGLVAGQTIWPASGQDSTAHYRGAAQPSSGQEPVSRKTVFNYATTKLCLHIISVVKFPEGTCALLATCLSKLTSKLSNASSVSVGFQDVKLRLRVGLLSIIVPFCLPLPLFKATYVHRMDVFKDQRPVSRVSSGQAVLQMNAVH